MDSAIPRQEMKDQKLWVKITKTLSADGPQKVVLTGEAGIGKTWLAKMVEEHASSKGLCYLTLWLHLSNKFDDEWSLYKNIAFQIEVDEGDREEEEKRPGTMLQNLKENISAELKTKKRAAEKVMELGDGEKKSMSSATSPYLLLILDDEGNKTSEDMVMKELGFESFLRDFAPRKILITRRKRDENSKRQDGGLLADESQETEREQTMKSEATNPYGEINFNSTDESQALLDTLTEDNVRDICDTLIRDDVKDLLGALERSWKMDEPLISRVVRKSFNLPAAIIVLAKSLNCITDKNTFKSLSLKQEKVLMEVLLPSEPIYADSGYNPVLHLAYKLLETDDTLKHAVVDCFWHSLDFFEHCGCIHHNELIAQWMLEGYFDPVRSVKKAYMDGHKILVELIKRGILKTQEDDMVVPEMAMSHLADLRHHGLLGRSQLRFARVYGGDRKKGLGRITQIDDMIKTVDAERGYKLRTILVNGNRLRLETSIKFFRRMRNLEVLGLFNPTMDCLIPSLIEVRELRVLVIRDCDLLSDIRVLQCLGKLNVLEISGASCLRSISDDFFKAMPHLQNLNLSGLQIRHSPSSISQLKHLHSLILRDCPVLDDLPDLQYLEKLEVVDIRGARKLKTCFEMEENKGRNRTFSRLWQLQLLDFSDTKIRRLPLFHDDWVVAKFHSLVRLSLKNCSNLIKLPNLRPLSALHILDLSGTTSLVEIPEVCFEQKEELKILNLSGTKFTKLPFTISVLSNLSQLLLRDSSNLEALPNIKGLTSLEILDVSGCTKLQRIEGSFEDMSYLREVNLSGTQIETFPELPEKSNICCLKVAVLADSRRLIRDTWSQVKEAIENEMSGSLSSSETSRKKFEKVDEPWGFSCPEKKCGRWEHFYRGHSYRDIYINTIPFLDTKNYQEVLEIRRYNDMDHDKETLAKVEFVVFVDNSVASLSPIFSDLKSVRGCWLEMCVDINTVFSGVGAECLKNLETLSITNFPLLDYMCSSSFNNLKKLNLDCCPSIKTLSPSASQLPSSLEVLKIKFCEKLEVVFEEDVTMPNLHTLCLFELPVLSAINAFLPNLKTYKNDKCPMLKTSEEDLRGLNKVTQRSTMRIY